ncbi:MAG: MFS transporter [Sphingobium sp.]
MSPARPAAAWPMLLVGALVYLAWDAATWAWYIAPDRTVTLPEYLFMTQDMPVLIGLALGLLALIPLTRRERQGPVVAAPSGWAIAAAVIAAIVAARLGRVLVFHDYSPSRDELMAEMAGAYLAAGRIGWPIPEEWQPFARAILPEFTSPYGAESNWTSVYLPVHAAFRALFVRLGDPDLASPVMLGVGLIALWCVARRLFPDRADVRAVVMLMALTSVQLLATAMTPYAMTSHFALNMIWLALILRPGLWSGIAAGVVLILAGGLHQWHFPILFAAPFIAWLFWRRRWATAILQTGALGATVLLWAKLWPMLLASLLGPPQGGAARGAPEVGAKVASLFGRLSRWQPLLNIGRLMAWNNPLLLPLGALSLARLPRSFRGWIGDPPIVLPLLGTVVIGFATAMYQGYGWGFRYMHGSIGALCLLAGYGWTVISPEGRRPLNLVWAAAALAFVAAGWQLVTTEQYVRPYARTLAAIRASDADAVLVDIRGGFFMTDLVRFEDGKPSHPVILALPMMTLDSLRELCIGRTVAVMDHDRFWPLGLHRVNPATADAERIDSLRRELDRLKCGKPISAGLR